MVALPELNQYSQKELDQFFSQSSLLKNYYELSQREFEEFPDQIRKLKHNSWLESAFATLAETHTAEDVCRYWSHHADQIILKTWSHFLSEQDVSLYALGKLGSEELNLSSDIDIYFIKNDPSAECGPAIRKFIQCLSEVRKTGFVFRVDTTLRPGGEASPILPTKENFFSFYDSYLEAWNRISFIRLRALTDKDQSQKKILDYCHRLSFPRRLDYSVIQDIKSIRSKLQKQWRKHNEPLDIKFHPGGIRDLELYIQSLQVIYGGRKPSLQISSISEAIQNLYKEKIINQQDHDFLMSFYWKLRKIENCIHALKDQHTYKLTEDIIPLLPFDFNEKSFTEELQHGSQMVSDFFIDNDLDTTPKKVRSEFTKRETKAIDDISSLKSNSLKRSTVEKQKEEILEKFIYWIDEIAVDKELALETFRDFIFSIKSKSSIFYLLNRNEKLLENMAWLFSFSPYIGTLLCQRPELVDSFALGQVDIDDSVEMDVLLHDLVDFKLLGQIISVGYLLKNQNIESFCENLSHHADNIAKTILNKLQKEFSTQNLNILCMGKWSGFELGIQSDLDFVLLCKQSPTANDMKVARRFINTLSTPTPFGKLYDIDMRLKPNQSAGPLLLEEKELHAFLASKAQAWQKQAYLKSRKLSNNHYFYKDIASTIQLNDNDWNELKDIRKKLITPMSDKVIDFKYNPGGLVDTEFAVQWKMLKTNTSSPKADTLSMLHSLDIDKTLAETLYTNYSFIRRFEQLYQICIEASRTKVSVGHDALKRLALTLRTEDPFQELHLRMSQQANLLKSLDANY